MSHGTALQEYLVEEEQQRECHMWSFSFITMVLCAMFLLQVLSCLKKGCTSISRIFVQHVRSGFLNSNRASRREVSTYHRGIWDAMDQVPGLCLD